MKINYSFIREKLKLIVAVSVPIFLGIWMGVSFVPAFITDPELTITFLVVGILGVATMSVFFDKESNH